MKLLSEQQKRFYDTNGYIKLEDVFSKEELGELSQEYDDLFQVDKKSLYSFNLESHQTV